MHDFELHLTKIVNLFKSGELRLLREAFNMQQQYGLQGSNVLAKYDTLYLHLMRLICGMEPTVDNFSQQ